MSSTSRRTRSVALTPRTLRARVTLATAAVLVLVLGMVGVLVDQAFEQQGLKTLDGALRVEAEALGAMVRIEGDRLEIDTDGAGRLDTFEARGAGAYYQVSAASRRSVRSPSLGDRPFPSSTPGSPELGRAAPKAARAGTSLPGAFEYRVRRVAVLLEIPLGLEGPDEARPGAPRETVLVEVARSMKELDRGRATVRAALGVALPIGLLLGSLGAFLLARRATNPIARLSADARAIGAGSTEGAVARLDVPRVEGELRELAGTLNDAFARLDSAVQRERRFSADASHELRTPLAVLRSRIELMLSRDRSPEEYRDALRTSLDASLRLEQVVRSLLLLARTDAGALAREPVGLASVVTRAVASACASAGVGPSATG